MPIFRIQYTIEVDGLQQTRTGERLADSPQQAKERIYLYLKETFGENAFVTFHNVDREDSDLTQMSHMTNQPRPSSSHPNGYTQWEATDGWWNW